MSINKIIEIKDLTVHYGNICALKNAQLDVYQNDFIGVIGPNGGGKSTFIKAIIGLIPHSSGSIKFNNSNNPNKPINIGYLPQNSEIDRKFPISVKDVIHSGLANQNSPWIRLSKNQKEIIDETIEKMGLTEIQNRPISALSGGQLQRVLLGRALISKPQLLILDEPTSFLDQTFEQQLYKTLTQANQQTAIIMVSHNIASVQAIAKSLACINQTLHYHKNTNISNECIYETFFNHKIKP